jgi:malonate transporter and related proteins
MHLAGTILPIFAIVVAGWLAGATGYVPRTLGTSLVTLLAWLYMVHGA